MKKSAADVALGVMATGAIAKAGKAARIGVDTRSPPLKATAFVGQMHGRIVGFDADRT